MIFLIGTNYFQLVTGDSLLTAVSVGRECGMILPEDMVVQVVVTVPLVGEGNPTVSYEPMGLASDTSLPPITNRSDIY